MKYLKWIKFIFILILLIASFILYSRYIGTKGLKIKEYSVIDNKIPNNFYGFKIVQISDIHYKVTTDYNDLKKFVNKINKLKPDLVIFTGDLFDSSIKYTEKDYDDLKKLFNDIDYNIAKYAIKGENDSLNEWEQIINDSNFINLNDKYELIYFNGIDPILLIGLNNKDYNKTLENIFNEVNINYSYSILAIHEPDIINKIDYNKFNLILASHSHGGQIRLRFIGGIIKFKHSKNYTDDYYDLGNTKLYISSGIGTHKYKFRFSNKPSINFYRLRNK